MKCLYTIRCIRVKNGMEWNSLISLEHLHGNVAIGLVLSILSFNTSAHGLKEEKDKVTGLQKMLPSF